MSIETYAKYWAENYKEDLTHNIMPFWLKYGLDKRKWWYIHLYST